MTKEITSAQWAKIDNYFDEAYRAMKNGKMDYTQYQRFLTQYIGAVHYRGLDKALDEMEETLKNTAKNGWKL